MTYRARLPVVRLVFGSSIALSLALACGLLGGCSDECFPGTDEACLEDPCDGDTCACRDRDDCNYTCGNGCDSTCERVDGCAATCGDDCDAKCRDATSCATECGADCATVCERVSTCDVTCGERCDVICRDLSSCDVEMVSGRVLCERISSCNVTCVGGEATTPAEDCGSGVFACGGC